MRKVFCTKYSRCLDSAIEAEVLDFDCSGCKHFTEDKGIPVADFLGCCILLSRVFMPDIFKEFQKSRMAEILGQPQHKT